MLQRNILDQNRSPRSSRHQPDHQGDLRLFLSNLSEIPLIMLLKQALVLNNPFLKAELES